MALHVLSGSLTWHYLCFNMALLPNFCKSIKLFFNPLEPVFFTIALLITTIVNYILKVSTYKEVLNLYIDFADYSVFT